MQVWETVFLNTPRLFETVDVYFRGRKCQTSHISTVETIEGTDPVQYRVKTMSGGVYIGPIGTEEEAAALWEATLAEQQEAA